MAIPRFFRPALFRNSAVQILPIGIHTFNQLILSLSVPALDLFFSFNGGVYIVGMLVVNKFCYIVSCGKAAFVQVIFMFIYPPYQIVGNSGINDIFLGI